MARSWDGGTSGFVVCSILSVGTRWSHRLNCSFLSLSCPLSCSLQNREKRKPKDERELLAKLRIFTRFFSTPEEHDQFVQVRKHGWLIDFDS